MPGIQPGQGADNHTEACRARMEASMAKEDDPRIARYNQRIVKASMKFMKASEASEELAANGPNTSVITPTL